MAADFEVTCFQVQKRDNLQVELEDAWAQNLVGAR